MLIARVDLPLPVCSTLVGLCCANIPLDQDTYLFDPEDPRAPLAAVKTKHFSAQPVSLAHT